MKYDIIKVAIELLKLIERILKRRVEVLARLQSYLQTRLSSQGKAGANDGLYDINKIVDKRFFDLWEQGVLILIDKIEPDNNNVSRMMKCLILLRENGFKGNLKVYIDSPGGSTNLSLQMYGLIRSMDCHKTAIVIGHAFSGAAIVLQAFNKRIATKNSAILIHNGDILLNEGFVDFDKIDEVIERIKTRDYRRETIWKILSEKSGASMNVVREQCKKDQIMNATEALAFGLIDEII